MELPWTTGRAGSPDGEATIMAARFLLTSPRHSPRFLLAAMRVRSQARRAPGLIGVALRAYPLRGEFWTMSAWTSEAALRDFAKAEPHRTTMRRFRPQMKDSALRFWTASTLEPRALWSDAKDRVSS